jgi:hypothetical protein
MWRTGKHTRLVAKPNGKIHSKELYMGGRIILNWILQTQNGRPWNGLIWLRTGTSGGFC